MNRLREKVLKSECKTSECSQGSFFAAKMSLSDTSKKGSRSIASNVCEDTLGLHSVSDESKRKIFNATAKALKMEDYQLDFDSWRQVCDDVHCNPCRRRLRRILDFHGRMENGRVPPGTRHRRNTFLAATCYGEIWSVSSLKTTHSCWTRLGLEKPLFTCFAVSKKGEISSLDSQKTCQKKAFEPKNQSTTKALASRSNSQPKSFEWPIHWQPHSFEPFWTWNQLTTKIIKYSVCWPYFLKKKRVLNSCRTHRVALL